MMMMIWQCVELLIALISVALVETSVQNKRNVKWREHFLPKYDGSLSIFFYCMHRTNTERASENHFYFTSKMVNFVIFHEKPSKAGQTWKKVDRAPGFYDISSFFFTSAYVTSHPSTVIWPEREIFIIQKNYDLLYTCKLHSHKKILSLKCSTKRRLNHLQFQ